MIFPTQKYTVTELRIYKSMHILEAFSYTERIMRIYISLGRDPKGHKQCEGDGKTPEGLYHINGRNEKSSFYKNLGISYPEARDLHEGIDPGGDIKIHALPNKRQLPDRFYVSHDWTEGCIAVSSAAMDYLFEHCPDGTPVVIHP
ncbi:MAG: L,D-transpeptidase family protein [Flavobacteriales bacterium]